MDTIEQIEKSCNRSGGSAPIPKEALEQLHSIGKILNIGWIAAGAEKDATIICPRSTRCPRDKHCLGHTMSKPAPQIDEIRDSLISDNQ